MRKHWSWCSRMFCTQLMTFLLLTAAQENAKSTGVFWSKRDSGIVSWCHPCQSEGTTTAWMDLHHWSCNCDGRTLVPHWSSTFLCAFLLQNIFLVLPYHWISTSLGPFVPPTSQGPPSSCMGCPSRKGEILLCCSCRKWSLKWHVPHWWTCVLYSPVVSELMAEYLTHRFL